MKARLLIFLFIFFLISFSVQAYTYSKYDYRERGFTLPTSSKTTNSINPYSDLLLQTETQDTLFNHNYNSVNEQIYVFNGQFDANASIAWTDLNNDGANYLVACSGQAINILNSNQLNFIQSIINTGSCQNIGLYKDSGDNYLVAQYQENRGGNAYITYYSYLWNGSSFNIVNFYNQTNSSNYADTYNKQGLKCNDKLQCIGVSTSLNGAYIQVDSFNLSDASITTRQLFLESHSGNYYRYFPQVVDIQYGDINNDGQKEFFFDSVDFFTLNIEIYLISADGSTSNRYLIGSGTGIGSNGVWHDELHYVVTSPLFGAFSQTYNKMFAIARKPDSSSFVIESYYWSGSGFTKFGYHPSLLGVETNTQGYFSSNIFYAKEFPQTSGIDYCVGIYNDQAVNGNNISKIMCATDFNIPFGNSNTYIMSSQNQSGALIPLPNSNQILVHGIGAEKQQIVNEYMNDFLMPSGIYYSNDINLFFQLATLTKSFTNPIGTTALYPISLKNSPYYDLLAVTDNALYYIDDGTTFLSLNPKLDYKKICPDNNQQWIINTTVVATVKVRSTNDLFLVSARAYLYYNEPNEQLKNWTTFVNSNSPLSFTFKANETTSNSLLRVEFKDTQGNTDNYTTSFTVGNSGLTYGDQCSEESNLIGQNTTNSQGKYQVNATVQDNAFKTVFYATANAFSIPVILLFVLLLMLIDLVVFVLALINTHTTGIDHTHGTLIFLIMFDVLSVIVGVFMGVVSIAFVITLLIIFLVIGALMLSKRFNNTSGG